MNFDATTFGHRLRHFRRRKGLTLEQLGELVGRAAPYLSLVENGKKEPRLSQIAAFARVLEIPMEELLASEPPNRRAQLEIELEQAQASLPDLGLPYVRASARLPDEVLVHLVGLYRRLQTPKRPTPATAGEVHRINGEMTRELASVDGYLAEVELAAQEAVAVSGYPGTGPISSRNLLDLAATIGFEIRAVEDVPASLRSITDLKNRVIYIAQRNELRTRQARKAILQTLGRFLLGHAEPSDHAEFLRQRRETAYFASAVLVPELAAVPFLTDSRARRDLSVEDLREVFYVSYETAAHRLANLATRHLGIRMHWVVSNEEGIAFKAYENDGVPFPRDTEVLKPSVFVGNGQRGPYSIRPTGSPFTTNTRTRLTERSSARATWSRTADPSPSPLASASMTPGSSGAGKPQTRDHPAVLLVRAADSRLRTSIQGGVVRSSPRPGRRPGSSVCCHRIPIPAWTLLRSTR